MSAREDMPVDAWPADEDGRPVRLVLGSTSPYRRGLLAQTGLAFDQRAPGVDERAVAASSPDALALKLAHLKAEAVAAAVAREPRPGGARVLVIGSDQLVDLDGEVLGKPGTEAKAVEQLMRMQGRSHRLVTAVAVHEVGGAERDALDVHVLTMRELTEAQVAAYVAAEQPLACAGSYKIEGRGLGLFAHVQADPQQADDTAIVGLPLLATLAMLRRFGVDSLTA